MTSQFDIGIIGGGPAAYTAAIYAARAGRSTAVFEGWEWGGLLQTTTDVENYPGFAEGILGPDLMVAMREQAVRCGAVIFGEEVTTTTGVSPFSLTTDTETYEVQALIIATGSAPRRLDIPGEDRYAGHGISWCATCDAAFFRDKDVVVIGGGDTACEEALFLKRFARHVTLVHRRDSFRASAIMQKRVEDHDGIDIVLNAHPESFEGDERSLTGVQLSNGQHLQAQGAFVAIGHIPRSQLVADWVETTDHGYIQANNTQTNVPGLFVAGDVADARYQQAITAAGSGCKGAMEADWWLESLHQ